MKLFLRLFSLIVFAAAAFGVLAPEAQAQCVNCLDTVVLPVGAISGATGLNLTGSSYLSTTFTSGIPAGNLTLTTYDGWCIGDPTGTLAESPFPYLAISSVTPSVAPSNQQLNQINYVLNNRSGMNSHEVQRVIWQILGQTAPADFPATTLSDALYNNAVNLHLGDNFIPGPGQIMGVRLVTLFPSPFQKTMIEIVVPECGKIGDYVWTDSDGDGKQGAGEIGINGVTVRLRNSLGIQIATTVTGFTPAGYGMLPTGAPGYYQFKGLCQGNYTVEVDNPSLSGYVETTVGAGGDQTIDSNNHHGAPVTLATNTSVDETIDFGYKPLAPITLTCAPSPGQQGIAYSAFLVASGGSGGYVFSMLSGALPALLALNANTGQISGTPTVSGTFPYTIQVTDSNHNTISALGTSCQIVIAPPPTASCVAITAIQNVPIVPVQMVGSGGAGGPYTFSASGLPSGLTMAPDGTISGTPAMSGTFTYTVIVTDKDGHSGDSFQCSVTVNPPPSASCVAIVAVQGIAITPVTMTGSGGTGGIYTFSASGLPSGLVMSTGGTISGTPTVSGTFSYTVTITDKDGHTGTVNCSVTVNVPPSASCVAIVAVQGIAIAPVTMIGNGGSGGTYTFTATGLPNGLTMSAGGTISGTPTVSGTFSYTVTVKDSAGNTGTVNCSVTVSAPPSASCVAIVAVQGIAITPVTMSGSGGSGGTYTFTATGLPNGLTMSTGGTISGTPTVSGTFSYTVTVKDSAGNTGTVNCSVTVNAPPSASCVAIVAVQGFAITPVTMTGSGGSGGPYTFTATGLPNGLTMSAGGTISGTPTVSGTFSYTVTVKDSAGNTGTVNCSVTVNVPPSATCVSIVAVQGFAITPVTMSGSGGSGGPYTFTAAGLPNGLTMSNGGTISGTPTVSGTFSYTVTVKDSAGNAGTVNCSVTVSTPPSASCVAIAAIQGIAITPVTMIGNGGSGGPYTFTATGLPNGLTMSAGGTISGTPTVSGTFSYTVTVKDSAGNTGTANCSVTVNAPPSATCVSIVAVQGFAITPVTMIGNGGSGGPYTFTATGLPNGLTMSAGGTISGTPTVSGTFSYTVTVKDSAGNTGTVNCSVTVNAPPSANCVAIVAAAGSPITPTTMTGSGGAGGPYTFTATGLPNGLTMSTGGIISGTPTASGTFNYTVTVKDKNGNTGTVNCSVSVVTPPTATCAVISNATVNVAITPVTMTGSGGSGGPYTFTASGLPTGLTMSSTGTISGTPTVAGSFPYTVTVTDVLGHTGTVNCSVTVNTGGTTTCVPTTFNLTGGNSASTGTAGNIRTFVAPSGIQVKASAWARNKTTGVWSSAYLGSYAPGLGVTNNTESGTDPSHKVGNVGAQNDYVMFEFSSPVVLNRAYLDAITGDSDITVWIGNKTNAFTTHNTLSDAFLTSLGFMEENTTTLTTARWADINTGNVSGNVIVIAALVSDASPEDQFKIAQLDISCATAVLTPSATCVAISAIQGVAITAATMTGTGGSGGPYTFTATGLPTGLTMSTTGTISGIPTVSGTFAYAVTVKDAAGHTGTVNCSITVNPPPMPSATCVAINATQGVAITSVTLIGTGGAGGPYTFTATGLPAGLTLSPAGVISGTPTVSGTFNYTVTIRDKNNVAGTLNCSVTVAPVVICAPTTIDLTGGSSATTGTFGNIRTFSAPNGVQVKISAFARNKTTGVWSTAYLGAYAPGLGVTNNSESGTDPSHKIDNVGTQIDYVLMEFSQPVVLNRAYLDAVTTDSDITVWIGNKTNPFTTHNTLSDAMLSGLGHMEENQTDLATARWADINAGNLTGNVIVIAALVSDTSPEDQFKLSKLDIACTAATPVPSATCATIAATQGTAIIPATLTGTGGAGGPYTFSATGLPTGLSMSTTGTISGTPTVSGTFNYTVTVKDKNNVAGTFVCSITVNPSAICAPTTFDFTSTTSSASTGTAGNIRTFTGSNGVQVKVSGFARNKTTGAWSTAWLGSYAPGLGVTDNSEDGSDPSHRVDNAGTQVNYVLMEFSQNVVLNRAFLDYVSVDSDVQIWIGTKTNPFANHITLSDAMLTGLGYTETNLTTSQDARWADVNAGNLTGNVIVIAALPTNSDDDFKLSKLDISCSTTVTSVATPVSLANSYNINGIYTDGVTFTGGGLDGNGYAYSSNLLGTSLTWNNTTFNFGPASGFDVVDGNAAVIALPAGNFSAVRILATAVNGNLTGQTFLVTYTDGTTSTFTQSMSDWLTPQNYAGETVAKAMAYRDGCGGVKDNRTFNLYGYSFTLNSAKTVASIKLPASGNVEVLAITLVP